MALALMREGRLVTNATMRQFGLDRHEATVALTGLVAHGLAVGFDGRRYAKYVLAVPPDGAAQLALPLAGEPLVAPGAAPHAPIARGRSPRRNRLAEIDALFDTGRTLTTADVMAATGLGNAMTARYLAQLVADGRIVATAPPTSRRRAYHRPTR
jgi:hypothetical protein